MKATILIPARMASTRFPGKPLADLAGKPMVQWVYEAALRSDVTPDVRIATPDEEIAQVARDFGADVEMTSLDHPSGTDRLAEIAARSDFDFCINVQGDEPLIDPATIRAVAEPMRTGIAMASVFSDCPDEDLENPAVVKVVTDLVGNALYFSRHSIPFARNPRVVPVKRHIGIYAYRRDVLLQYQTWPQTPLEQAESLEQLRFMENGIPIRMVRGEGSPVAVDTPEQADEARRLLDGRF